MAKTPSKKSDSTAHLGFEAKLWLTADKLIAGQGDYEGANTEDPDEYKAENVFWVPAVARWPHLQAQEAKQPAIGKVVDDVMVAIERNNPHLKLIHAELVSDQHGRDRKPRHRNHLRRNQQTKLSPDSCRAAADGTDGRFTVKVAPLYAQITTNLHQSHSLATLRDTLLPKLLSGELTTGQFPL